MLRVDELTAEERERHERGETVSRTVAEGRNSIVFQWIQKMYIPPHSESDECPE